MFFVSLKNSRQLFVFGVGPGGVPDVGTDATSWTAHKDDGVRFPVQDGHDSTEKVEGNEDDQEAQENDSETNSKVRNELPIEIELA